MVHCVTHRAESKYSESKQSPIDSISNFPNKLEKGIYEVTINLYGRQLLNMLVNQLSSKYNSPGFESWLSIYVTSLVEKLRVEIL